MKNQFPGIPGMVSAYRDGQLVRPETGPQTGNMVVVDYGLWGPVNELITVPSYEAAVSAFGRTVGQYGDSSRARGYNGNALALGIERSLRAGNRNLSAVRLDFGALTASSALYFKVGTITVTAGTAGVDPADDDPGTSAVLTATGHDLGVIAGMRMWYASGSVYEVIGVSEGMSGQTEITTITLAPKTLAADADGATWASGFMLKFEAAYPGKVGNSFQFKVDDEPSGSTGRVITIKAPGELGGFTHSYSSGGNAATWRDFLVRVGKDFNELVVVTVAGVGLDDAINAGVTPYLRVVSSGAYLNFGESYSEANGGNPAYVRSDVVAGTDYDASIYTNFAGFTLAYQLDKTQKHKWYATALGNCLVEADDTKALGLLRGQPMGIICIPSLYVDDMTTTAGQIVNLTYDADRVITGTTNSDTSTVNALQYLIDFCHQQNVDGIPTRVCLGVSPLASPTLVNINARATLLGLVKFQSGDLENTDGVTDPVDAGIYTDLVAGPQQTVQTRDLGAITVDGAIEYAVLLTTTPVSTTPTRKVLPGTLGQGFVFTRRQISNLAQGQGANKDGGAWVVFDVADGAIRVNMAVTAAKRASDFANTHNIRVVQKATNAVRAAVSPFIGSAFDIEHNCGMETAIESALDELVDMDIISGARGVGFDFTIKQTAVEAVLGECVVELSIRPNFELKWIILDVKLRA